MQIPTSDRFRPISVWSMRLPMLINVLIPIGVSSILYSISGDRAMLLLLLWIPVSLLFTYITWRHAGYLLLPCGLAALVMGCREQRVNDGVRQDIGIAPALEAAFEGYLYAFGIER